MLTVEDFLTDCLRDARALGLHTVPLGAEPAQHRQARQTFLAAGLAAVRAQTPPSPWTQLNLTPAQGAAGRLYRELGVAARGLLADGRARNFFFMHKEPGLRVRFEPGADGPAPLRAELVRRFAGSGTLREPPVRVVYEPEQYLFGGPAAMPYVHRLFTADALAWLDHHAQGTGAESGATAWRLSLLLLREVFAGLGIVGWEHRGVWEVVRGDTGRGLDGYAHALPAEARRRAAEGIAAVWRQPAEVAVAAFPPERRAALADHAKALREAAAHWRTGYFEAGDATVGPRTAAAYFTVFHWNRGALSAARQGLLTDALAGEGGARAPRG